GPVTCPIGACTSARGGILARRKNARAAIPIDSAGAAVLNATRSHRKWRRYETKAVLIATMIIAGAGPKKIAEAMKNVSVTEKLAPTDAILIVNCPARSASATSSSQTKGGGICA